MNCMQVTADMETKDQLIPVGEMTGSTIFSTFHMSEPKISIFNDLYLIFSNNADSEPDIKPPPPVLFRIMEQHKTTPGHERLSYSNLQCDLDWKTDQSTGEKN